MIYCSPAQSALPIGSSQGSNPHCYQSGQLNVRALEASPCHPEKLQTNLANADRHECPDRHTADNGHVSRCSSEFLLKASNGESWYATNRGEASFSECATDNRRTYCFLTLAGLGERLLFHHNRRRKTNRSGVLILQDTARRASRIAARLCRPYGLIQVFFPYGNYTRNIGVTV